MDEARFQFQGFKIIRSLIERKPGEHSKKISLGFDPKGFINKKESHFQLQLGVKIEDENKIINIEILALADFFFYKEIQAESLNKLFFINAPALLFPYIRAYISTLTNLSGFDPVTLPTLNLTRLGDDLKENTTEVES